MESSFSQNFGANLKIAAKQLSSYVMIAMGTALQAFVSNTTEADLVAKMGTLDFLTPFAPYAGYILLVAGLLAKAWPQKAVTNEVLEQAEKVADVTVVPNDQLPVDMVRR